MTKSATLYIRVSTVGQVQDGVSMAAQEARLRSWAAAQGYEVLNIYRDAGISGKSMANRPGLQKALEEVCTTKGVLAAYSLSRLGRSVRDMLCLAERLQRAGADLASVTEAVDTTTAAGKMVFTMLAVLAEFERQQLSERTRMALEHKRHRGEKLGGSRPYGYQVRNGKLVPDDHEQAGVRMAVALRRQGFSLRAIAERLHREGFSARPLTGKTVAAILRRHVA